MQTQALENYQRYEFHPIVSRLQTFCSEELGAFYLDILKDRLYTTQPNSHARRSAQTALYHISHALIKLMAPILSFTAEEAWQDLHFSQEAPLTIFTELFHELPLATENASLLVQWERIREIRAEAMRQIETLRSAGQVGSSLAAEVDIYAKGEDYALLAQLGDDLRFVFLVSRATLHNGDELRIEVAPTTADKCDRCWHHSTDVGSSEAHPSLCGRCVTNLDGIGELRAHA